MMGDGLVGLVISLGGLVAAIIVAFLYGKKSGKTGALDRLHKDNVRAKQKADYIEDAVAGRSPEDNRERLRRW